MKKISFVINTSVNTLDHVKLLLKSLKENLHSNEHEILIFVDSDNENSVDYLRQQKKNFFDLKIITHKIKPCVGYSRNNNILVQLAKHDIVSYLQSDMVVSKNYDLNILEELEDNCILSSTRIEPPLHGESDKTITQDFGTDPNLFKWEEFMQFAESVKQDRSTEYFFAPFTFYKKVWLDLGGYDTLYRRSREDTDLLQRFMHAGVKIKQTFKANVYHFTCVTSRGKNWFNQSNQSAKDRVTLQSIADQIELRRFIKKWGNFNHGENILKKYDIDLVIKGKNNVEQTAIQLEPFFSRVWVEDDTQKVNILNAFSNQHDPANKLLNFSDDDWSNNKRFYNQIDYTNLILKGEPDQYNVKITLDTNSNASNFFTHNNLINLSHIIESTEVGDYESGNCIISIKQKKDITPTPKIENPSFDTNLLVIE